MATFLNKLGTVCLWSTGSLPEEGVRSAEPPSVAEVFISLQSHLFRQSHINPISNDGASEIFLNDFSVVNIVCQNMSSHVQQ